MSEVKRVDAHTLVEAICLFFEIEFCMRVQAALRVHYLSCKSK